jgi:hypothetical protein
MSATTTSTTRIAQHGASIRGVQYRHEVPSQRCDAHANKIVGQAVHAKCVTSFPGYGPRLEGPQEQRALSQNVGRDPTRRKETMTVEKCGRGNGPITRSEVRVIGVRPPVRPRGIAEERATMWPIQSCNGEEVTEQDRGQCTVRPERTSTRPPSCFEPHADTTVRGEVEIRGPSPCARRRSPGGSVPLLRRRGSP